MYALTSEEEGGVPGATDLSSLYLAGSGSRGPLLHPKLLLELMRHLDKRLAVRFNHIVFKFYSGLITTEMSTEAGACIAKVSLRRLLRGHFQGSETECAVLYVVITASSS